MEFIEGDFFRIVPNAKVFNQKARSNRLFDVGSNFIFIGILRQIILVRKNLSRKYMLVKGLGTIQVGFFSGA